MKYFSIILMFVVAMVCPSCKGSSGKKAASEAVKYFEKKGGKLLEKEESNSINNYKNYRRVKKAEDFVEGVMTPNSKSVTVRCSQCSGYGAVYLVDEYGYYVYDYYGNPQVITCPSCGGTGQKIVYQ